jgi:hypothetical protein
MPEGFAPESLEYKRFVETHTFNGNQRCGITTGLKQIGTVDADHLERARWCQGVLNNVASDLVRSIFCKRLERGHRCRRVPGNVASDLVRPISCKRLELSWGCGAVSGDNFPHPIRFVFCKSLKRSRRAVLPAGPLAPRTSEGR